MEERLSALFEHRVGEMREEMKKQSERMNDKIKKQRVEMEKQRVETNDKIESLRSNMARVESDNAQLKIDNSHLLSSVTRLTSDLTEIHDDLRILHPLPYARLHLQKCITHQIACNEAVNAFIDRYTLKVINVKTTLSLQLQELKMKTSIRKRMKNAKIIVDLTQVCE